MTYAAHYWIKGFDSWSREQKEGGERKKGTDSKNEMDQNIKTIEELEDHSWRMEEMKSEANMLIRNMERKEKKDWNNQVIEEKEDTRSVHRS